MLTLAELPVSAIDDQALPGDLLLYRDDNSLQELLISRSSRSIYGHAGMLARNDGRWIVLEMTEARGGQWRFLQDAVREDPGRWDLFNAGRDGRWPFDRRIAVREMWSFVNRPYGWRDTIWDGLLKLPLIRALVPADMNDLEADNHFPNCSEADTIAYRKSGVIVVPNLPPRLVEPGDLARSMFFEFNCTLKRDHRLGDGD